MLIILILYIGTVILVYSRAVVVSKRVENPTIKDELLVEIEKIIIQAKDELLAKQFKVEQELPETNKELSRLQNTNIPVEK